MRALQALKGVGPVVAATIIAEVGDFSRFAHPRQLVAYFGR
jgi:transposase